MQRVTKSKSGTTRKLEMPADALVSPLKLMSGYVAARKGEHWRFTDEEAATLSEAIVGILVYMPVPEREVGIFLAIQNLTVVSLAIFGTRLAKDNEIALAHQQRIMHDAGYHTNG